MGLVKGKTMRERKRTFLLFHFNFCPFVERMWDVQMVLGNLLSLTKSHL